MAAAWVGTLEAQSRTRAAACVAASFSGYLRPAEAIKLRKSDVEFSSRRLQAVVKLVDTKTGKRKGADEFIEFDDPLVVTLLKKAVDECNSDSDPLFGLNYNEFRSLLRSFCDTYGLSESGFRLYSLRRGGAAYDFRVYGSYDRALERGRWAHVSSAKVYLHDARAALISLSFPGMVHETFRSINKWLNEFLSLGLLGDSRLGGAT
jgi:integrase